MSGKPRRLSAGSRLLGWIFGLAVRRPRRVVGGWLLLVLVLAFAGRGLDEKLTIHPVHVGGTASTRAHEIADREFGSDYSLVVLLRGPRPQLRSQARSLDRQLNQLPGVSVITPWAGGAALRGLAPSPRARALVVRFDGGGSEVPERLLQPVRDRIDATIATPVHASVAGFPAVIDALRKAGQEATLIGELIAFPVLILVLLFVFRSVLAALLPVVVGGAVIAATRGSLSFLLGAVEIDLFASGVVAMMGLALGVDYSLLAISRFREERERRELIPAVETTVEATARSIIPAGSALILAMIASGLMMPGSIGPSVALSVSFVALLSMLSAVCVVPAMLILLGDHLDRWSLAGGRSSQLAPLRWSRRIVGRPGAVGLILAGLLLCAALGFGLESRSVDIDLLPPGDSGRNEQETVERTLGPGWLAPTEVLISADDGPVTSTERLDDIDRFQRQIEADPGVAAVTGLGEAAAGARRLSGLGGKLAAQQRGLSKLEVGLSRARAGSALGQRGLSQAAQGAGQLDSGLSAADDGSGALAQGLQKTSEGSGKLAHGLDEADDGSGQLAAGAAKASGGAGRLARALRRAKEQTGEISDSARLFRNAMRSGKDRIAALRPPLNGAEERLESARQALLRMSSGKADPEYDAVLQAVEEADRYVTGDDPKSGKQADPDYAGLGDGLEGVSGQFDVGLYLAARLDRQGRKANSGLKKLADAAARLDRGLGRLADGSRELADGVARLSAGGGALAPALGQLSDGASHLAAGLGQLGAGAGQLAEGLAGGAARSGLLTEGLTRMRKGLAEQSGTGPLPPRQSPDLFRSPYLVLAGLDGSEPDRRQQVSSLINLEHGGSVTRMLVIGRDKPTSEPARETIGRIESSARRLARQTDADVVLGGVTLAGEDLNDTLRERAPLMRVILSLIGLLILIPVMRSLTMPLIAALLNILVVGATFGILALLFNNSLLGGPGYVDVSVVFATLMIVFALAIDYEVFVFSRMREEYDRTGSPALAVANGLDRTAHVVTGAAVIMIAVFLAFSVSGFMSIRNFGVAQAVGVFIDAFIVRLILIPSVMTWLGARSWWAPRWLARPMPSGRSPERREQD